MHKEINLALSENRVYVKSPAGLIPLSAFRRPIVNALGDRFRIQCKLPSGTVCEITQDSAIAFVATAATTVTRAAYVVVAA